MTDIDARENPFVGLRPFFEEDSFYFFGRNEQVAELLELLNETHFVPVLGSSGSGKSSLVRAGLMPTLRAGFMVAQRDGWRMAKCLPGDTPIENLAEGLLKAIGNKPTPLEVNALAERIREDVDDAVVDMLRPHVSEHETVLILVDQFEELFAFRQAAGSESDDDPGTVPDAARTAERLARRRDSSLMVSLLLALAERKDMPVYVVTTMRTDFLGDCDIFSGLPEAINRSGYLVPRLTRAQLRAAVESPARLMGARAAPRLVDRILNDVGDRMDRLPLMQHALHRTYEAWRRAGMMGPIDLRDLDSVGGLDGALNQQAEATIADIDASVAERVFKRLTAVDKNQRRVRHPTRLSDLRAVVGSTNVAALQTLLDRCVLEGTNFMFASSDGKPNDPRYNITHESLIRQWNRLRGWVDEEQAQRDWYLAVASRAARYASDSDSGLMPRRDLRDAEQLIKQRAPNAGWAARYPEAATSFEDAMAFVQTSATHLKRVRINIVMGVAAVLLIGAVSALSVFKSGRIASEALKRVDDVARYSAIEKLLTEDPTYAAALAAELTDTADWNPERLSLLQRVLTANYAAGEFRHVEAFDLDGSGTEIAIGYPGGRVEVGDIDGVGAPHAVFQAAATDSVVHIAFVKNRRVLVGYGNGNVRLWRRADSASSAPITTPERSWQLPARLIQLIAIADSTTLIALDDSLQLFTWRLDESKPRTLLPKQPVRAFYAHPTNAHRTVITTLAKNQAGNMVNGLRVLDVTTGAVSAPLAGVSKHVTFVSFRASSDEMLVGQSRDRVLYFKGDKNVASLGDSTYKVSGALNPLYNVAMTSNASGFIDQYWRSGKGTEYSRPTRILAHEEAAQAQFSRDGNWILSWSSDGSIRWTSTVDSNVTASLTGHRTSVAFAVTAPTDSRIASWDAEGTLRVWRTPNVAQSMAFSVSKTGLWNADLTDDGSKVLLGYDDRTFSMRSLVGDFATEYLNEPLEINGIPPVISPSGRRVFFEFGREPRRLIWSVGTKPPAKLPNSREPVQWAAFSDDDSVLVLAHLGGRISFHNATTGVRLRTDYVSAGGLDASAIAIVPHSHTVAIAFEDSVVLITRDTVTLGTVGQDGESVSQISFSADGGTLLTMDTYGSAEVVKTDALKRVGSGSTRFRVENSGAFFETATAISTTGALIAIATNDRVIKVYDTRQTGSAAPRAEIKGLPGTTVHLTFGADERTLVATGGDGDIRIWNLASTGALGTDVTPLVLQHTPKIPHQRDLPLARSALSQDGKFLTSVVTLFDNGTPRIGQWDLDFSRIRFGLETTTSACVDVAVRKRLLPNETDDERRERTEACERRAGRLR